MWHHLFYKPSAIVPSCIQLPPIHQANPVTTGWQISVLFPPLRRQHIICLYPVRYWYESYRNRCPSAYPVIKAHPLAYCRLPFTGAFKYARAFRYAISSVHISLRLCNRNTVSVFSSSYHSFLVFHLSPIYNTFPDYYDVQSNNATTVFVSRNTYIQSYRFPLSPKRVCGKYPLTRRIEPGKTIPF
jgi:hypothetical protein